MEYGKPKNYYSSALGVAVGLVAAGTLGYLIGSGKLFCKTNKSETKSLDNIV